MNYLPYRAFHITGSPSPRYKKKQVFRLMKGTAANTKKTHSKKNGSKEKKYARGRFSVHFIESMLKFGYFMYEIYVIKRE